MLRRIDNIEEAVASARFIVSPSETILLNLGTVSPILYRVGERRLWAS